jgi:glycosyltransferase involved in cell wall biosynthesis
MSALVSVLLPFRDAGATIDDALAGLLARDDPALEVIAVDDGSTDSGPLRVRTWAARDRRVRLIAGDGGGLVSALNRAASEARGSLFARMDADDIAHPERIARQRAHLLVHPELAVLGTQVRAAADDGAVGEGLARYVAWQNGLITAADHARERYVESPLCHPSIVLRRTAFEAVGGYRALDGPEDYELFLRLLAGGYALAKLSEVLLTWRHREGRATFRDARYGRDRFRAVKAPYLAASLDRMPQRRIVIWGAGPTGRRLARALSALGVAITGFIDIDPDKVGRMAQGVPIRMPATLDAAADVVVAAVGARGARLLIREELQRRGFVEGESAWLAA